MVTRNNDWMKVVTYHKIIAAPPYARCWDLCHQTNAEASVKACQTVFNPYLLYYTAHVAALGYHRLCY